MGAVGVVGDAHHVRRRRDVRRYAVDPDAIGRELDGEGAAKWATAALAAE